MTQGSGQTVSAPASLGLGTRQERLSALFETVSSHHMLSDNGSRRLWQCGTVLATLRPSAEALAPAATQNQLSAFGQHLHLSQCSCFQDPHGCGALIHGPQLHTQAALTFPSIFCQSETTCQATMGCKMYRAGHGGSAWGES